jgi:hypothetical protein
MKEYEFKIEWIANPLHWLLGAFTWLDGSHTIGIGPLKLDMIRVYK